MARDRLLPTPQSSDLPTFKVSAAGRELSRSVQILSVVVQKSANRVPTARLMFKDGDAASETFKLSSAADFVPGTAIEIAAGYHNDHQLVFKGVVIKQNLRVKNSSSSFLIVECKEKAYSATIGRRNRYFADQKDSDVIEELLGNHQLENSVEATTVTHRQLVQFRTSDWDFIVARAEVNGKLTLVDNGKVSVAKPSFDGAPVVKLTFGANLLAVDATLDASHQHSSVVCKSWDQASQEIAESEAASPSVEQAGNLSSADLAGKVSEQARTFGHTGPLTSEELQAWADAQRTKNTLAKIRGTVRCKGLSQVKPGAVIELAGLGDRFNGKHLVSAVRHELSDGAWEMDVQLGLWPELFAQEVDVTELPAAGLLPAVHGLQIGVVTQLQDDPDSEQRILVKMPIADPNAEGTWARVATLDAGANRGSFFLPEIGDEVVLGFLNNDPRHAIVLGMLNSSSKPAPFTAADDNPEKGFVTREKLKVVFNDETKVITIETPGGNILEISDENKGVMVKDENGNKLEMNDQGVTLESASKLTLKAATDFKIEGANVTVSAQSKLKAEGSGGAELSSSGTTGIRGSMVNIN